VKRLVRSFGVLVLLGSVGSYGSAHASAAAGQAAATGSLSGTALSSSGLPVVNAVVQLRNLTTGQLTATTMSNGSGQFSFTGLPPGNYAVEIVNATGQIIGTSSSVSVGAGAAVAGVDVTAATAVAGAAAGAGAGAAGSTSTAAMVGAAAAAAGVAGAAFTNSTASPSQ
jgi:carboxypeptidase family protein